LEVSRWDANTAEGARFHEVLEQLSGTTDDAKRKELSFMAQELIYTAPPAILLYLTDAVYGVSKKTNWQPRQDEFIFVHGLTLG
jgi:ABC-type transport system substrate-binding protein